LNCRSVAPLSAVIAWFRESLLVRIIRTDALNRGKHLGLFPLRQLIK